MPAPHPACRLPPWLRDLAGAWIFYSVLPAWPGLKPRFERIARFAPWIGALPVSYTHLTLPTKA